MKGGFSDALLVGPSDGKAPATKNQMGTINGCYIPCLLNILGAPLFLYVGFTVGHLGWVAATEEEEGPVLHPNG